MIIRNFPSCFVALMLTAMAACTQKKTFISPPGYDINNPTVINLNSQLNEISGVVYYPKDTSVFAISDENGLLFKIFPNKNGAIEKWPFEKKHDFEDVVLKDSTFYVLMSNGDILTMKFEGDKPVVTNKTKFPGADKETNEFETLYYDSQYKQLVLICKDCQTDKKKEVTAFGYNPDSATYTLLYKIDVKAIDEKLGEQKMHLKPSAAAINPVTNDLYIVASINRLLVITDRQGKMKSVYELNPSVFKQPEGITFTPRGDMIISNEAGENLGNGNLLIFKYQNAR